MTISIRRIPVRWMYRLIVNTDDDKVKERIEKFFNENKIQFSVTHRYGAEHANAAKPKVG